MPDLDEVAEDLDPLTNRDRRDDHRLRQLVGDEHDGGHREQGQQVGAPGGRQRFASHRVGHDTSRSASGRQARATRRVMLPAAIAIVSVRSGGVEGRLRADRQLGRQQLPGKPVTVRRQLGGDRGGCGDRHADPIGQVVARRLAQVLEPMPDLPGEALRTRAPG